MIFPTQARSSLFRLNSLICCKSSRDANIQVLHDLKDERSGTHGSRRAVVVSIQTCVGSTLAAKYFFARKMETNYYICFCSPLQRYAVLPLSQIWKDRAANMPTDPTAASTIISVALSSRQMRLDIGPEPSPYYTQPAQSSTGAANL